MAKAFVALRLDGHETVVRAFGMLPHAVQGRAIRPALRAGAADRKSTRLNSSH